MRVTVDQTCDFAEQWRYQAPGTTGGGIWIAMEPHHVQFATDWANIVLVNFIEYMAEKQRQKKAAAEQPAPAPSIVLTGADS
jgi:hypothetical protein